MMPHKHFLVSTILIIFVVLFFFPTLSPIQFLVWILLAGIFSVIVDIDMLILIPLSRDKKILPYRNFSYLNNHFNQFMKLISKNGIMKTSLKTHILLSLFFIATAYFFINTYFIPIIIGVISHLLSDIPNLRYY